MISTQGHAEIRLNCGAIAKVDQADFARIDAHRWRKSERCGCTYATRRGSGRRTIGMHREVLGTPAGMHTDHVNGDGLDNRRANLRAATVGENLRNRKAHSNKKGAAAGFKGVGASGRRWRATICLDGHSLWLGTFDSIAEAAAVYDAAALRLHGAFARTNATLHPGLALPTIDIDPILARAIASESARFAKQEAERMAGKPEKLRRALIARKARWKAIRERRGVVEVETTPARLPIGKAASA